MEWLVCRTNPILENRVQRQMSRAGHTTFSPSYVEANSGRLRRFFPSYLFVHSPTRWYHLLRLVGVIGVLAGRTSRVPFRSQALDAAVEGMIEKGDCLGHAPAPPRVLKSRFRRGDRVRICSGVMRDCYGQFEEFRGGRSCISLDGMGATVTVSDSDLALLEERHNTSPYKN